MSEYLGPEAGWIKRVAGSLNAAAVKLGVSHATVLRRVGLFEQRHGQAIFQRRQTGCRVLPEAEPVLRAARNVEDAVLSVDCACIGADQSLSGTVRIASTDSFCQRLLPPTNQKLSRRYPDVFLTVLSSNTRHDFFRLSADIAIRPARSIEDGMAGRMVGEFEFALYRAEEPVDHWLGLDGPLNRSRAAAWMEENVPPSKIVHRSDSFLALQELVACGVGKAILPRYIGDKDPRLVREVGAIPVITVPVWTATLEELAGNARSLAVQEVLSSELADALSPFCG